MRECDGLCSTVTQPAQVVYRCRYPVVYRASEACDGVQRHTMGLSMDTCAAVKSDFFSGVGYACPTNFYLFFWLIVCYYFLVRLADETNSRNSPLHLCFLQTILRTQEKERFTPESLWQLHVAPDAMHASPLAARSLSISSIMSTFNSRLPAVR